MKTVVAVVSMSVLLFIGETARGAASPESSQIAGQMVCAWSGSTSLGYLRVELWSDESRKQDYPQQLVIKGPGLERTVTQRGVLVMLPAALRTPNVFQVFVRCQFDVAEPAFEPAITASVSSDGTLRLFRLGIEQWSESPPELKPTS